MATEHEAKFRVASHDPVRQRLEEIGATRLGLVIETNEIYDRPDGSFRRENRGLRVRSTTDQQTGEIIATLTFKGPLIPGPFKSRREMEIIVSDAETTAQIMTELGFDRVLWYQKRRESWWLDPCKVELDQPPHIGLFVEIEGPGTEAIQAAQKTLGLSDTDLVRASYPKLLVDYCQQQSITEPILPLPK